MLHLKINILRKIYIESKIDFAPPIDFPDVRGFSKSSKADNNIRRHCLLNSV